MPDHRRDLGARPGARRRVHAAFEVAADLEEAHQIRPLGAQRELGRLGTLTTNAQGYLRIPIGVALSGIGSAYKGQGDKNPALDLLMRQIDQYVEDGYRAKAALGQEAGMYKDRLGQLQDQATNTVAQKQLAVAGIAARGREGQRRRHVAST